MSIPDDGGFAFPQSLVAVDGRITASCDYGYGYAGMTLRDYLAAQALQGHLANDKTMVWAAQYSEMPGKLARLSYEYADAMLEERMKTIGGGNVDAIAEHVAEELRSTIRTTRMPIEGMHVTVVMKQTPYEERSQS